MPPYAASLLFELYKSRDDHYVQIFYRNTTVEHPLPIHIPNCGIKCRLSRLYEIYSDVLPLDFETECTLPKNSSSTSGAGCAGIPIGLRVTVLTFNLVHVIYWYLVHHQK